MVNELEIFSAALELQAPEQRARYLDEACGDNRELRRRIDELLGSHADVGSFMSAPASERAPEGMIADVVRAGPGTLIGPYKLLEQIGEGGFGVVFMAEQQEPVRRKVALKVLKPGMDTRQVVARFEAERQALAIMDHPNIAKVLDGGATDAGRPYFAMELVKGVPITEYCDQNHLTPRHRLELFVHVCQAVQHAHQKGIIHRDLKPSNILVTVHDTTPVAKVIDFGVAKALGRELTDKTMFTGFAQMIGTPLYMSPEQAGMSGLDIDTRSDIYSLGVLLYELLTGTTPFDKERFKQTAYDEICRIIREEEPPRPSTRLSESKETLASISAQRQTEPAKLTKLVRGDLDWIVMKALDKDRNRRYETANGLAMDLRRYLADEPVQACPPSAGYRLRKFVRRHRPLLFAAAVFTLMLTAGIVVSTWQAVRATWAERDASDERDKAVAEKQRGDEEAAIAKTVDDFLQKDLLGQADIANQAAGGERNRNITVRELLDRAARSIEPRFKGQERTESAIRLTLGRAYRALGEFPEAQKHLDRSFALRKDKLGARHPHTLESLDALALLAWFRGRHEQSEALFRQVLDVRKTELGDDHADTLTSMNNLANLWWQRGRLAEAEDYFKRVLSARSAKFGSDHPDTLGSMSNLAMLYGGSGRYAEAEPMFKQVVEGFRGRYGPDHPQTLRCMNNLAAFYLDIGRYDEAERRFQQLLEIAGRVQLGDDHLETARYKSGLATVYLLRRRHADAEPLFRHVLKVRRSRLDADHADTLTTMNDLAVVCMETRRFDEAEPLFRDALTASRVKPGAEHPLTLKIMNGLASLCALRGQYDEAEVLFGQVLEARRAIFGADHPETLISVHNLGASYRLRARYDKAEPLLLEAAAGARKKLGPNHPHTRSFLNSLVLLYEAWGNPLEADRWRKQIPPDNRKQKSKN
jgi:serine/threonine protein kinase/tetratricopeptide (TPR) repeat protein